MARTRLALGPKQLGVDGAGIDLIDVLTAAAGDVQSVTLRTIKAARVLVIGSEWVQSQSGSRLARAFNDYEQAGADNFVMCESVLVWTPGTCQRHNVLANQRRASR